MNGTGCPPGTYRDTEGGADIVDCYPCTGGYYCANEGQTGPTDKCYARYYCPDNAEISTPDPTAYQCPAGFFCEEGTSTPDACVPGTYQPAIAKTVCEPCPPGYFCMVNSSVPSDCTPNHYCPESSIQPTPCPDGTYSDQYNLQVADDCEHCPRGKISDIVPI